MGDQRIVLITPDNSSLDAHNPSESRKNGKKLHGETSAGKELFSQKAVMISFQDCLKQEKHCTA